MSAKNFFRLSILAYKSGRFDEAGAMFAQAAESEDIESLVGDLNVDPNLELDDSEDTDEQEESTSSSTPVRRRSGSLNRIGLALSASMEAVASDEELISDFEDDEDQDGGDPTPDPDIPGERLIPASFSSGDAVPAFKSAVKLKPKPR
jgi:hypothetical protein